MVESKQMPPTAQEIESLEMLRGILGDSLNADVALSLLRRNDGDLNKTASALLEGDTGDTIDPSVFAGMPNLEPVDAPMQGPRTPPRESPFLLSFREAGWRRRGSMGCVGREVD